MPIDLAILIPTINGREQLFDRLHNALNDQISKADAWGRMAMCICKDDKENTTGFKRNVLLENCTTKGVKYIAFFDDDDLPGPNYIKHYLACIDGGYDCSELWGSIYFSGKKGKPFHHSLKYNDWFEDKNYYYRTVNHLNCMKLDLVKDFKFRDQNFGEDAHWSLDISKAGVLKTMYPCEEVIYHYFTGVKGTQTELDYAKSLGV